MAIRQIEVFDKHPPLNWWKKLLRRWLGSQDIVAVAFVLPDNSSFVLWYYGVDIRNPVTTIESCGSGDWASVGRRIVTSSLVK